MQPRQSRDGMMAASTTPHRATMKKQPLDYFRKDHWAIRLVVLLIDRFTWPLIAAAVPISMKVLHWALT
ncbi:hypothetical protein [Massilia oculi]|uniref:hypothetical protein n=1 Tax=Massilia oculi TaxID=945844 RepID=UPI001AAE7BDC|nr:hypothetical protein [Massilia oculi]